MLQFTSERYHPYKRPTPVTETETVHLFPAQLRGAVI